MALEQIGLEAVLQDANFQTGVKRYVAGLSQATGQTEKTASGMSAFGHTMSTAVGSAIGFLTAQAIPALIGGLHDLAGEALNAYASHERLGMALTSLTAKELLNTGQAKDMADAMKMAAPIAADLQGWIQKLAIQSPFTQEGVATAFRTAQAYGFTGKEAQRLTQAMIDFAAGSGASESAMGTIALALGQIKAKGKLAGQEVLQLVNAGLSVDAILAKAFGKSTAEIVEMREKGLIPADKAIEAITQSLEKDFGGAAKRQAGTFSGLLSSLSDIKEVGLREFFTGTFQAIQPYIDSFVSAFSDPAFMASLKDIGTVIGTQIGGAIKTISGLFAALKGGGGAGDLMESIGLGGLARFWKEQGPSIVQMATDTGKSIADAFGPVIADAIPFVKGLLDELGDWFADNGPLISQYLSVVGERFAVLARFVAGAWKVIKPILKTLFDVILGLAKLIMQVAVGDWKGAWKTIQNIVKSAWDGIKKTASEFGNWVASWMGTTLADIGKMWRNNWEMLKIIVNKVTDDISKTITGWLNAVKKFFGDAWDSIVKAAESAWRGLGYAIENAIKRIDAIVKSGLEAIRKFILGIWEFITSDTSTKWAAILSIIAGVVTQVIGTVRSGFEAVKSAVEAAWAAIRDGIYGWWQQITQAIWNAIAAIPGLVADAIEKLVAIGQSIVATIRDALITAWNAAGGIVKALYDRLAALWDDVKSGELLEAIGKVAKGIVDSISSGLSSLWSAAGGVVAKLRDLLSSMWEGLQGLDLGAVGQQIINAIIGGIQAHWQSFIDWLLDAIRGIFGSGATGTSINSITGAASAGLSAQPVTQLSRVSNVSNVFNLYVTTSAPVSSVIQDFGTMQALAGV